MDSQTHSETLFNRSEVISNGKLVFFGYDVVDDTQIVFLNVAEHQPILKWDST